MIVNLSSHEILASMAGHMLRGARVTILLRKNWIYFQLIIECRTKQGDHHLNSRQPKDDNDKNLRFSENLKPMHYCKKNWCMDDLEENEIQKAAR